MLCATLLGGCAATRAPEAEVPEAEASDATTDPGVPRREPVEPYALTAHRQNFIMPFYATTRIDDDVYEDEAPGYEDLSPVEARFRFSLKAQLNGRDLLLRDDALSFGLTLDAFWQLYDASDSRPIRETVYTPELFYTKPLPRAPLGGDTSLLLGFVHQSNGRDVGLSRGWNRLYAGLIHERGDFAATLRAWYRIPEEAKDDPEDPRGDDNPDIVDYLGHGDLFLLARRGDREYGALARLNPSTGHGALRLSHTFPLNRRFRGLVEYFVGYGDSLIDYDHFQQRVGVGVALTDLF